MCSPSRAWDEQVKRLFRLTCRDKSNRVDFGLGWLPRDLYPGPGRLQGHVSWSDMRRETLKSRRRVGHLKIYVRSTDPSFFGSRMIYKRQITNLSLRTENDKLSMYTFEFF